MAELTFENPAAFADFVQSLEGAQVARILSIASFSLVVYDYAITLDEEVSKLVWKPFLFLMGNGFDRSKPKG